MRIKSKNGRDLYQGKFFNWLVEPIYHSQLLPEAYMICLDDINNHSVQFTYYPDSNILQIRELKFHYTDITKVEEIIKAFIDANGSEIPPLFKHINDVRKEKLDEIMVEENEDDDD
jgi:hypothetical protein